jgi:hypothetical protein
MVQFTSDIRFRIVLENRGKKEIRESSVLAFLSCYIKLPNKLEWFLFCRGFANWEDFIRTTSRFTHEDVIRPSWNQADSDFLANNHGRLSYEELSWVLNCDRKRVKTKTYRNKLKPFIGKRYTQAEIDYLHTNYRILSYKEMADELGRSKTTVRERVRRFGWSRTPEESQAIQDRCCKRAQFKPGHKPKNTLYDGATTIRPQKNGSLREFIRLSENNWKKTQIYRWEKIYGPVPKGMVLRCVNGNALDTDPVNWKLITQSENLEENSGNRELTDKYLIDKLCARNPHLKNVMAANPSILELKRAQLKLNRTIHGLTEKNSSAH